MLIRITDHCHGGCSHCFTESTPKGGHMALDTFKAALKISVELGDLCLLISGGEPTDHPDVIEFLKLAKATPVVGQQVLLLSHGMWLTDPAFDAAKRQEIIDIVDGIQVTNDPRYYPRRIERVANPKIAYEDHIRQVVPFGRAKTNKIPSERTSPLCFNLRSFTRSFGDIRQAIVAQRMRGSFCTPSINTNGDILAGEAISCCPVGNVHDTWQTVNDGTINLKCNNCGLVDNLSPQYKAAIGEV